MSVSSVSAGYITSETSHHFRLWKKNGGLEVDGARGRKTGKRLAEAKKATQQEDALDALGYTRCGLKLFALCKEKDEEPGRLKNEVQKPGAKEREGVMPLPSFLPRSAHPGRVPPLFLAAIGEIRALPLGRSCNTVFPSSWHVLLRGLLQDGSLHR